MNIHVSADYFLPFTDNEKIVHTISGCGLTNEEAIRYHKLKTPVGITLDPDKRKIIFNLK